MLGNFSISWRSSCQKIFIGKSERRIATPSNFLEKLEQVCGLYEKCRDLIENRIKQLKINNGESIEVLHPPVA